MSQQNQYVIKCPHCGQVRKYICEGLPFNHRAKCFRCEKTFIVHTGKKSNILSEFEFDKEYPVDFMTLGG